MWCNNIIIVVYLYRNMLSEYDDFEAEILEQHTVLQLHSSHTDNESKHHSQSSLQSLSGSFKDHQQRYKELKESCAKQIEVSACSLSC